MLLRYQLMKIRDLIILLVLLLFCGNAAFGGSADERFAAGLRERQLYRLACEYCRRRLAQDTLPDARRTELVIELARSLAEWAVASPPRQRDPRWQEALAVLHNDLHNRPANPRAMLLRLQEAHVHLARGELAREEAQFAVDGRSLLDEARVELRAAVRLLRELNEEAGGEMRRSVTGGSSESLSADELASLRKTVQYETARALRNQGECFAAQSADRANSAAQAIELLEPLARLDNRNPLCWKSRVDRIACMILAGDYKTAVAALDALDAEQPPPLASLRLRALRMEAVLADGQLPEAVALLSLGRQIDTIVSPQLDYIWLKTCLTAWQAAVKADKQEAAGQWQAKANKMARLIAQSHGPYWARRAEMLAGNYYRTGGGDRTLETLVYAAESAFRSGQIDEALTAYDRAAAAALSQSDPPGAEDKQRAFDLAFTAAMIEQRRERHEQAAMRFRQLALNMPDNARAAGAHWQAIWNAGRPASQPQAAGATDAQTAERHLNHYAMLLDEHALTWPDSPTADESRWMLGRLKQYGGDWAAAVAAYRSMHPGDERFGQAVRAAGQCYATWLGDLRSEGEATASIARQAADWFESLIAAPQGIEPQRWEPIGQEASLAAARLRLNFTTDGFARAQRVIEEALAAMPATPAADADNSSRRAEFEMLLVLALAGQGRREEADELLRTVDALRPRLDKLSPAERYGIDVAAARAMADVGRVDEAMSLYRRLIDAKPADIEVHESLARLLAQRQDRASMEASLREWRLIEKQLEKRLEREKSNTDRAGWFRAKLQIARLHVRLGNKQRAAKMVELMSILHPDLGGPEMKLQFEKILAE